MPDSTVDALDARTPSAVGLTRLGTRFAFTAGGEALYRSVVRLVELGPGAEFLVVPCGRGRSARLIADLTGAAGAGADPDPLLVAVATERARQAELATVLHFEHARLDNLPYHDAVFDVTFGEVELAAVQDPQGALRELIRVTRPGGTLVLVQLVWLKAVAEGRREALIERLGLRPLMLVEWKQVLRDAGVTEVRVEDWSEGGVAGQRFPLLGRLSELFSFRARLRLIPRAWGRWGWRGVRAVMTMGRELRQLLEEERILGFVVMTGRVAGEPKREDAREGDGQ